MVLCLLSRDSHGDWTKSNHKETVGSPFLPEKVKFYYFEVGFLVKIQKKSDSTHSSSEGAVNAHFLTGLFSK